jgi:hypothetical protein
MILHCTYEELTALGATAGRVVSAAEDGAHVAAPTQALADVASLQPRLHGDLSIATLEEQRSVERAVEYLLEELRVRMNDYILSQHVGSEDSINAYFDYAHVHTLRERVRGIGREMAVMIELMTGEPPTAESARSVTFSDD